MRFFLEQLHIEGYFFISFQFRRQAAEEKIKDYVKAFRLLYNAGARHYNFTFPQATSSSVRICARLAGNDCSLLWNLENGVWTMKPRLYLQDFESLDS